MRPRSSYASSPAGQLAQSAGFALWSLAALEGEASARAKAESQLAQERRALVAEVHSVQAAGQAALRQLQRQVDTQRRQLEAEARHASQQAAELAARQAAAHLEELQRLQVGAPPAGKEVARLSR